MKQDVHYYFYETRCTLLLLWNKMYMCMVRIVYHLSTIVYRISCAVPIRRIYKDNPKEKNANVPCSM